MLGDKSKIPMTSPIRAYPYGHQSFASINASIAHPTPRLTKHLIDPEVQARLADDALHAPVIVYLGREGLH